MPEAYLVVPSYFLPDTSVMATVYLKVLVSSPAVLPQLECDHDTATLLTSLSMLPGGLVMEGAAGLGTKMAMNDAETVLAARLPFLAWTLHVIVFCPGFKFGTVAV